MLYLLIWLLPDWDYIISVIDDILKSILYYLQDYYCIWNDNIFNCWSHDVFVRRNHFSDLRPSGSGILYFFLSIRYFTQCKTSTEWNKSVLRYIKYKNENIIYPIDHVTFAFTQWIKWNESITKWVWWCLSWFIKDCTVPINTYYIIGVW